VKAALTPLVMSAAVLLAGPSGAQVSAPPAAAAIMTTTEELAKGEAFYRLYCTGCHGPTDTRRARRGPLSRAALDNAVRTIRDGGCCEMEAFGKVLTVADAEAVAKYMFQVSATPAAKPNNPLLRPIPLS